MGHPGYAAIAFESMDYLPGMGCFILGQRALGHWVGIKEKTLCPMPENAMLWQFPYSNSALLVCIKSN